MLLSDKEEKRIGNILPLNCRHLAVKGTREFLAAAVGEADTFFKAIAIHSITSEELNEETGIKNST